jgi:hypothetical protein
LHDWRDVGRRPFDHHLLHTPDQAQTDHHLQSKTVGIAPLYTHRNTSNTHNMAGHPMVKNSARDYQSVRGKKPSGKDI